MMIDWNKTGKIWGKTGKSVLRCTEGSEVMQLKELCHRIAAENEFHPLASPFKYKHPNLSFPFSIINK